jgi:hypothetical protein
VLPVLDFSVRRQWRQLAACVVAALGPVLVFGLVDWVTWGAPFHSMIEYVRFNTHEASTRFGSSPAFEYLTQMRYELGWPGVVALALPIALEIRAVWTWTLGATLLLVVLSAQAHKENRFVLVVWALLAVASGSSLGRLAARDWRWGSRRLHRVLAIAGGLLLIGENAIGLTRLPAYVYVGNWPLYEAQAWVGERADLTGVLVDTAFTAGAGWSMLGRNVPLEPYRNSLLDNPIFNYFIVRRGSRAERVCREFGSQEVWSLRDLVVLYRRVPVRPLLTGPR